MLAIVGNTRRDRISERNVHFLDTFDWMDDPNYNW